MSGLPPQFARDYLEAISKLMRRSGEDSLHQAYEIGRQALSEGLGVLDLIRVHHHSVAKLTAGQHVDDSVGFLARAAEFLAECLSPFEMTLRGYQESNARLIQANTDLRRANAEVAAAHEQLKAEISERKHAEESLLHTQKLQAVGHLAGGIAHHFNNLLTVILGNLELASSRTKGDEKLMRYISIARHGAERGAQVTQQLLTFSRKQMLRPRLLDLVAWLEEVVPLVSATLRGDIAVAADVQTDTWPILVDSGQLELAFINLAVNARDAMPRGGTLRISLQNKHLHDEKLGLNGDYVLIGVSDTGEGIAPDILPRIFEPFFTTKEAGSGTGLGLSQVHGFVHQSGGAVDIDSTPGKGTTVLLYLPAGERLTATKPPQTRPEGVSRGAGSVLIVEDDPAVGELVTEILEGHGYSVTLSDRAQSALELLSSSTHFDIVFSDVMMPGNMNGVQLAEEVYRYFPKLPVLLTSGFSDAVTDASAKGFPIMIKPYNVEELARRIGELIRPGKL